jgi:hypothetical protein
MLHISFKFSLLNIRCLMQVFGITVNLWLTFLMSVWNANILCCWWNDPYVLHFRHSGSWIDILLWNVKFLIRLHIQGAGYLISIRNLEYAQNLIPAFIGRRGVLKHLEWVRANVASGLNFIKNGELHVEELISFDNWEDWVSDFSWES